MKILALDSSGLTASVAVLEDDTLTAEYTVNYKKTHSQTLIPMLDAVRNMTELNLETVDAVAVAAGPGSFTGMSCDSGADSGCTGLPDVWFEAVDLPDYGCTAQSSVYRAV